LTKQIEQLKIDQSDIKARELAEALSQLGASNELLMKSKEDQIVQLTAQLEDIKGAKSIQDFRAEATLINGALISQTRLLCQQLVEAESLCDISTAVCEQIEKARTKLDQAEDEIIKYIEWQDTPEGQAANFTQINATYKNILFVEWETQVMKAERAASRCETISKKHNQFSQ
jgi:arsenate reductase-like glutaredoxin family protein